MNPMTYRYQGLLGTISKISGYSGSVIVKLEKSFLNNLPGTDSVFVEVDGKPVPFFISGSEYNGGELLKIKFDYYDSPDKMEEFIGCRIYIASLPGEKTVANIGKNISGFKIILRNKDEIGIIKEVIHNPGQDLLRVISSAKKEILIPYHEDFIIKIDHKKESIMMELPEGLIDIF